MKVPEGVSDACRWLKPITDLLGHAALQHAASLADTHLSPTAQSAQTSAKLQAEGQSQMATQQNDVSTEAGSADVDKENVSANQDAAEQQRGTKARASFKQESQLQQPHCAAALVTAAQAAKVCVVNFG